MERIDEPPRKQVWVLLRIPFLWLLILMSTAFLLKLPYLPTGIIAGITVLLLSLGYAYARIYLQLRIPLFVGALLAAAIGVDATGNYLHIYDQALGPLMYDEFAHMSASALTIPAVIWLIRAWLQKNGHQLPLGLITFLGIASTFSADAFYEIIELWDELYFGGKRIWSFHDAPRDLQWDLAGLLLGGLITYLFMRRVPGESVEVSESQ